MIEELKTLAEHPEMVEVVADTYKPLLYSVAKQLFEIYKDFTDNNEWFEINAKYSWKTYNALIAAGFDEKQAFALLLKDLERWKEYGQRASVNFNK